MPQETNAATPPVFLRCPHCNRKISSLRYNIIAGSERLWHLNTPMPDAKVACTRDGAKLFYCSFCYWAYTEQGVENLAAQAGVTLTYSGIRVVSMLKAPQAASNQIDYVRYISICPECQHRHPLERTFDGGLAAQIFIECPRCGHEYNDGYASRKERFNAQSHD